MSHPFFLMIVSFQAISPTGYTPNENGVHVPEGGHVYVDCSGGKKLVMSGSQEGTIIFTMKDPTFVNYVTTTGLCKEVTVELTNGSTEVIDLDLSGGMVMRDNVAIMTVGCTGAGSIKEISYMFCPPEPECPLVRLDFNGLTRGNFITDELKSTHYVEISAIKRDTSLTHRAYTPAKNLNCSGQSCYTQDAGCLTVSGGRCQEWKAGAPRVFDTSVPTCGGSTGDPDLGAPNREFPGGVGEGCGGGTYYQRKKASNGSQNSLYTTQLSWSPPPNPGCIYTTGIHGSAVNSPNARVVNPFVNNSTQGMVLVINEWPTTKTSAPFSGNDCPDDTAKVRDYFVLPNVVAQFFSLSDALPSTTIMIQGGYIVFKFDYPVSLQSLEILDTDEGNTPEAWIKYCDGTDNYAMTGQAPYKTPETGDNGFAQVDLQEENVCELAMKYYGSGSIAEVAYGVCPPPPPQCVDLNMACYKCSDNLDCVIDDSDVTLTSEQIAELEDILSTDNFCQSSGGGSKTYCSSDGQQYCDEAKFAFTSQSDSCVLQQAKIGNAKCPISGGPQGQAQGLSNFAAYQINLCAGVPDTTSTVECMGSETNCSSGTCSCPFCESSFYSGSDIICDEVAFTNA